MKPENGGTPEKDSFSKSFITLGIQSPSENGNGT